MKYGISNITEPFRLQWLAIDGTNVYTFIGQILGSSTNQAVHRDVSIRILLFEALSTLIQQKDTDEVKNIDLHQPLWLEKSISFMSMHYKEGLSVKQVADWIGVSRTFFSQYFTKYQGAFKRR